MECSCRARRGKSNCRAASSQNTNWYQRNAVIEFDTFEKAMSFKDQPDYVDALNELGDDETKVLKRTSFVISDYFHAHLTQSITDDTCYAGGYLLRAG